MLDSDKYEIKTFNAIAQYGKDDPTMERGRIMRKIIYPIVEMPNECIAIFHRRSVISPIPPALKTEYNARKYCTLFFFVRGYMNMIIDKKTYYASNGNIVVINENRINRTYTLHTGEDDYYGIDISPSYIKSLKGKHFLYDLFYNDEQICHKINDISDLESVVHWFKMIENNQNANDLLLFSYVIQTFQAIHNGIKNNGRPSSSIVNNAMEFITHNFKTIRSISEIADFCNVNTSHLCTSFRQKLNCSVNEILKRVRFQNSVELINNGNSFEDAAYESGFINYKYYQSLFKEYYGMTPKRYLQER